MFDMEGLSSRLKTASRFPLVFEAAEEEGPLYSLPSEGSHSLTPRRCGMGSANGEGEFSAFSALHRHQSLRRTGDEVT